MREFAYCFVKWPICLEECEIFEKFHGRKYLLNWFYRNKSRQNKSNQNSANDKTGGEYVKRLFIEEVSKCWYVIIDFLNHRHNSARLFRCHF